MSVGKILALIRGTRAHEPVPVSVSDGTMSFPYGHLEYYIRKQPDGMLLLDLAKKEYSEFKVNVDRDFFISLYNQVAGSRYKLFIYRGTTTPITVSFENGEKPITIEGTSEQSLFVLSVEVAKVGEHIINKVVDNIYDDGVSINNTWSSKKISDKLTEEAAARQSADEQILSDAKSYTDSKDTTTNQRIDAEISERQSGDAQTLSDAKSYTDSKDTATNQRIDTEISERQSGDSQTLSSANSYTDTKDTATNQRIDTEISERQSGDAQTLSDAKNYTNQKVFDAYQDQSIVLTGGLVINYTASSRQWYIPNTITSDQFKEFVEEKLPKTSNHWSTIYVIFQSGTYTFTTDIYITNFAYAISFRAENVSTTSTKNVTFKVGGTYGLRVYYNVYVEFVGLALVRNTYYKTILYLYANNKVRLYANLIDTTNAYLSGIISFNGMSSTITCYNNYWQGDRIYIRTSGATVILFGNNTSLAQLSSEYIFYIDHTTVKGDTSGFDSGVGIFHTDGNCIIANQ